ncbi:MAG: hypothetical protein M1831_004882 [Alyxoria varia]|nr:MAG: hypothetical protein M1831_004882 [Alyxoria varia]
MLLKKTQGSNDRDRPHSVKLARSRRSRLFIFTAFLLSIFFILALYRASPRISSVLQRSKPAFASRISFLNSATPSKPLTSGTMASSAFKKPPQAPPVFTATPQSIIDDTKLLILKSRSIQDAMVKHIKPEDAKFANTMLLMAQDEDEMSLKSHILGFYQATSTNKEVRDASTEAEKLMEDFAIESSMREDVFKLVDTALKRADKLDPESQRLLEKDHKEYIKNGLNLTAGPQRDRFKEIKKELSDISINFQKRLNEENGGLWFTTKELEGVPKDVVDSFEKGKGDNEGKVRVTFKYPDYFPCMKYCTNPEVRQKILIENENKCNENAELFRRAVILRDEAARLLGFPNHAAFRIEDKMAKTPKFVDDFLGDLKHRLAPGGKKDLNKLKQLKEEDLKTQGEKFEGHYFLWDHRFYDRLMLEKEYSLDQEKISEYFPLSTTIQGMLRIFEELFGLDFHELTGDQRDKVAEEGKGSEIVWHEDVQVFSVWDDEGEGGEFVGYLYLDLFPREGKYGHAANFNLQPGFIDKDGNRRFPATALVCNFSKPKPTKPSLLKHDEVVTLFHELGHGIHDLVSRTTYSRFHGTNTVRDFVEAPSQMLENWCWTPSQLRSLSRHWSYVTPEYKTAFLDSNGGEPQPAEHIPDDLIDKLIKTKHVNDALANLRQLHFGTFDMLIHEPESHEAVKALDIPEKFNKMRRDISGMEGPEALGRDYHWGHGEATFGHLIGGYDAGYYGYLSSQVYSADMFFSVFKKDPLNGKEGRRYRHQVLEKGGSQDEMETLKGFLGREPSTEPFYKELGLS